MEVTLYPMLSDTINNRAPSPTLYTILATVTCGDGNNDILLASF